MGELGRALSYPRLTTPPSTAPSAMKPSPADKKIRWKANTKPCRQCAWAGLADECRYKHKTQSCERCLQMKDTMQCSGVRCTLLISRDSICAY